MRNLALKTVVLTYFTKGPMTTDQTHNLKYLGALPTNMGTSLLFSPAFQRDLKGYYIWEKMVNPAQAFTPGLFMIKFIDSFYLSCVLPFVLHKVLLLSLLPEFSD